MRYFFDNNVAPPLVEVLRLLKQDVVHIAECTEQGMTRDDLDVHWMRKVAELGWIAVTVDNHIRRRKEERRMLADCKLRVVFLHETFANMLAFPQAVILIRAWEGILEKTKDCAPSSLFDVTVNTKTLDARR